MHFVYVLECADGSLYCGYTTDLERRLAEHNGDRPGGARYTRGRRPAVLVHQESFATRSEAQVREAAIKKMTTNDKRKLIVS